MYLSSPLALCLPSCCLFVGAKPGKGRTLSNIELSSDFVSTAKKGIFVVYYEKARIEQLISWEDMTYLAEESLSSVWSGRHLNILMKRDRLG